MQKMEMTAVDQFAELLGVQVLHRSFDEARCQLNVKDEHMNALGGVHGGVIFSLADIAFAMACNAGDAPYTGLQADIRYMSGAKDRVLFATATKVGSSKKFAHYEVLITDGLNNRVALFTSTCYRLAP
ncbi:PaaI family thioesterase [Acinetobacter nosocomialis]|uniref:PaaI family thioesterase n=1 Tax=Acinetobacter nosocomialis TaxID=106654 RepID=UPI001B835DA8|nr:PaaI family thioesterase [Acinetobacter nosocomialis]